MTTTDNKNDNALTKEIRLSPKATIIISVALLTTLAVVEHIKGPSYDDSWEREQETQQETQQQIQQMNRDEYERLQHEIAVARTSYERTKALRKMEQFLQRIGK